MRRTSIVLAFAMFFPTAAHGETRLTAAETLRRAKLAAPDLKVARQRESIAVADVGVAGILPNPVISAGTSTQAARLSVGVSLPLLVLGQRGASVEASEAELATVRADSDVAWADARAGAARAYVVLWLAQERAAARRDGSAIARRLDEVVAARVELGAAPDVDGLRTRAERLRAEADAQEADALVSAAASQLAFYLSSNDELRADGEYGLPDPIPTLPSLEGRLGASPNVKRELSDARAADARVAREKALVRPVPVVDLGADFGDPTLPTTNYRAQLALEVPLFSLRGPRIERERASGEAARARSAAELARARASLDAAYGVLRAADARAKTLRDGVLAAAEAAERATQESYTLGRAQLVAVLDAVRARVDARLALAEALATRANAWIDIERAVGSS